jgi:hypothetical protein
MVQFAGARANCDIHHNIPISRRGPARYNTVQYHLSNNYSNNGGGIYASSGPVDSNTLSYNRGSNGSGICATSSIVTNNVPQNNYSGSGSRFI